MHTAFSIVAIRLRGFGQARFAPSGRFATSRFRLGGLGRRALRGLSRDSPGFWLVSQKLRIPPAEPIRALLLSTIKKARWAGYFYGGEGGIRTLG
jgi:hypothetical protein